MGLRSTQLHQCKKELKDLETNTKDIEQNENLESLEALASVLETEASNIDVYLDLMESNAARLLKVEKDTLDHCLWRLHSHAIQSKM